MKQIHINIEDDLLDDFNAICGEKGMKSIIIRRLIRMYCELRKDDQLDVKKFINSQISDHEQEP